VAKVVPCTNTSTSANALQHGLLGPLRRGQQLARQPLVVFLENHIGESAANVDSDTQVFGHQLPKMPVCLNCRTVDRRPPRCNLHAKPPMVAL
jgi:hypothetical protein